MTKWAALLLPFIIHLIYNVPGVKSGNTLPVIAPVQNLNNFIGEDGQVDNFAWAWDTCVKSEKGMGIMFDGEGCSFECITSGSTKKIYFPANTTCFISVGQDTKQTGKCVGSGKAFLIIPTGTVCKPQYVSK